MPTFPAACLRIPVVRLAGGAAPWRWVTMMEEPESFIGKATCPRPRPRAGTDLARRLR